MPFNYFTYGVACAEVELDVLTGDMTCVRADVLVDLGRSLNPALDIGQIEGAFAQGVGLFTMEELVWGNKKKHKWVRDGQFLTLGPGAYKIPSSNDVPLDFRVSLLKKSCNPFAVHSSKAVGEPPLFMGSSVAFAARQAVQAARKDAGCSAAFFPLDSPLTPERLRMACADDITRFFAGGEGADLDEAASFRPAGCW